MNNWAYWRVRLFGPANSLGRRITIYTIAFSSLIMLVISVAQLGFEYRDLRTGLDKELDGIEVFVPNLSGSVWSFDQKQIQLALDGLDRLPNIGYVRVTTVEGGKEWVSGSLPPSNTLSRNFDLSIVIKGKNTVIGHLVVVAGLDEINQQIIDRAVIIVLSNGLKSFLVALFSLFLFRHLIAHRLEKMAGSLRALKPLVFPASAPSEMPAQNWPERSDELDVVEWTLSRTENDLRRASVELEQHRDHLQALVEERTHELRMQNEELLQARDALDASQARYVDLYDLAPVGYCSVNEAGLITQSNLTLATLLGEPRSKLARQPPFSKFVLSSDQDNWYRLRTLLLTTGAPQKCELRLRRGSAGSGVGVVDGAGASVWVELVATVAQDEAGDKLLRIAIRDITERTQVTQALQQSLKDKEALLKEVHHRVKNNLQVITSLLRLEAGRSTVADTKEVLGYMRDRIRTMAQLHESLHRSGTFASVDLGAYLGQVAIHAFKTQEIHRDSVRLTLNLGSVQAGMDQATAAGMLLNELISNCLKHGFPEGRTGEVCVELQPAHDQDNPPDGRWSLRVVDTGVGLPPDVEDKRRASLGLQLVTDLSNQLGGTLVIDSVPGQGARFGVVFPVQKPAALVMPP